MNDTEQSKHTSLPGRMPGSFTLFIYTQNRIDTYMQLTTMLRLAVVHVCRILTSYIFFVAQSHHYENPQPGCVKLFHKIFCSIVLI